MSFNLYDHCGRNGVLARVAQCDRKSPHRRDADERRRQSFLAFGMYESIYAVAGELREFRFTIARLIE